MEHISHSAEETKRIAADFARMLRGGEVVLLEGGLGSGKTTFVQGVAEALGISEPVRSPTFAVLQTYPISSHSVIRELVHMDAYRLKSPEDIADLGLEEWLGRPDVVFFMEWPWIVSGLNLPATHEIIFSSDGDPRRITLHVLPKR
ncbi:tRNA (adenosine(37)-N6)-threonylcarbamoyltransferase complex ATPase subunit type 1 TsaE [Candidatus Uhrbacteria bacterium]|nr:tRNA (adenosine(37)-N6)-threonylcarbamoyltransferase complex ATPase subunit type 1 TsaE [Candidatus Uhrbacteria bacterium]